MPLKKPINSMGIHPPVGTWLHPGKPTGSLQLVEVLGVGGYGVVYRAVQASLQYQDPRSLPKEYSFAVKCLLHSLPYTTRKRQLDRERYLHQYVSDHPNIVTLLSVLEEPGKTYMIMEYAPDRDLFTQILNERRYLGNSELIKTIFLQVLEAVEYCHHNGIYHRDLKPENILCFDGGHRIALTDFGLATQDKLSTEFRTGSVFHMSPECQDGGPLSLEMYSPEENDIWALGIILLNLTTGRNPWMSAAKTDATFQAYLQHRQVFFPSVLPVSEELNNLLLKVLDVHWQHRMSLDDLRRNVQRISTLYSETAVFKDNLAQCHWETGVVPPSSAKVSEGNSMPSYITGVTIVPVAPEDAYFSAFVEQSKQPQWQEPSFIYSVSRKRSPQWPGCETSAYNESNTSLGNENVEPSTFDMTEGQFSCFNYEPIAKLDYPESSADSTSYFPDASQDSDMLNLMDYNEPEACHSAKNSIFHRFLPNPSPSQGIVRDIRSMLHVENQQSSNGEISRQQTNSSRNDTVFGVQLPWSKKAWLPF